MTVGHAVQKAGYKYFDPYTSLLEVANTSEEGRVATWLYTALFIITGDFYARSGSVQDFWKRRVVFALRNWGRRSDIGAHERDVEAFCSSLEARVKRISSGSNQACGLNLSEKMQCLCIARECVRVHFNEESWPALDKAFAARWKEGEGISHLAKRTLSLLGSVVLGRKGGHMLFGVPVLFSSSPRAEKNPSPLKRAGIWVADKIMFKSGNGFIHEGGHALANRLLYGKSFVRGIWINTNSDSNCGGLCYKSVPRTEKNSNWAKVKDSIICAAGPLTHLACLACVPVGLLAFTSDKNCVSVCSGLSGLSLAGDALFGYTVGHVSGEVAYALSSLWAGDDGDFGRVAKNGIMHLLVANEALVVLAGLGVAASGRLTSSKLLC